MIRRALMMAAALLLVAAGADDGFVKPVGTKGGEMALVAAGPFKMGCNRNRDRHCDADENPYHEVNLSAYYIDRYEVTASQYQKCVADKTCREKPAYSAFDGPNQPAVGVSWQDAQTYCKWAGKRLPTEAEWEKAARGTDGRVYPWGNSSCGCDCAVQEQNQIYGCGEDATLPVGSAPNGVSPYGCEDMAGNVWEWVADWYDDSYYKNSPKENPPGPETGDKKVRRGGGFGNVRNYLRASDRNTAAPTMVSNSTGFRCAMTVPPPAGPHLPEGSD